MATGVGLHVADDACTAAIVTDEGEQHFIVREPVLHMADDGDATLGGRPPKGPTHTITGFVAAVGDPAGVSVDDGEAYRGEDLLATALFCLINLTAEHLSGPAEFYATHPAHWPQQQVHALREALDYLGLGSVALLGEAELPEATVHTDEPGKTLSAGAASAALSAVLDTPAGATPPDPAGAENSTIDTVVMPAVTTPEPRAKAYSATMPAANPTPGPATTHERATVPAAAPMPAPGEDHAPTMAGAKTPADATTDASEATDSRSKKRTPLLIAGAALLGLLLGGTGVALYVGADSSTPAQKAPGSEQQTTITTPNTTAAPTPPPTSVPPLPPPPPAAPTPTEDPAVTITTTTELPPSTTEPPPSSTESEAPTTTSEPQSSTSTGTTSPSGTTLQIPLFPDWPSDPSLELPELGY